MKYEGLDPEIAGLLKEINEEVFYTVEVIANSQKVSVDVTCEMAMTNLKFIDIVEKSGIDREEAALTFVKITGNDIFGFKNFEMSFKNPEIYAHEDEKHESSYINAKYKDGKRYSLVCKVNLYSTMDEVFKKIQSHAGEVAHYLELSDDEQW